MPLETGTYISDLVSTNPVATDGSGQGDDHLRLIKSVLLATFPSITGAVTASHTTLNSAVSNSTKLKVTSADTTPEYLNDKIAVAARLTKATTNPAGDESLTLDLASGICTADTYTNPVSIAVDTYGRVTSVTEGDLEETGVIKMFGGSSAPTGYLMCNGDAVNRTTYADLFAVIGTSFGSGDGSTTFNVPDMRGRAPIGVGTGTGLTARAMGATVGAETHTLTEAEMPAHTHSLGVNAAGSGIESGGEFGTGSSGSTGGGGAHNNMQPSLAVNFIIKT